MDTNLISTIVDTYTSNTMTMAQVAEHLQIPVKQVQAALVVSGVVVRRGPRDGGALSDPTVRAKAIATRQHKAIRNQLAGMMEKYGEESFREAVMEVLGDAA
jgi:hypothetical protein